MKNIIVILAFILIAANLFSQEETVQLQHEGQQRSFIIYSPCQTYDCAGKSLPVVFVFHGLTQTAAAMRDYTYFNNIADTAGFVAVYPQGINNGWNVGFTVGGVTTSDDVDFTETIIKHLRDNMTGCTGQVCPDIDTNNIFSCGMSNGGFFSYHLACHLSSRIKAIASVTGSMTSATFNNCSPSKPIPVLEIHGDADAIVPYNGSSISGAKPIADVLNFWINHNGCPVSPVTFNFPDINTSDNSTVTSYSYKPCTMSEVLHYKVTGGGHCWIGSASAPAFGNTCMDVDASTEIWKFFKQYTGSTVSSVFDKKVIHKAVISPNPSNGYINIDLGEEYFTSIQIIDLNGRIMTREAIPQGNVMHTVDISDYQSGLYFVRLSGDESVTAQRIMIE